MVCAHTNHVLRSVKQGMRVMRFWVSQAMIIGAGLVLLGLPMTGLIDEIYHTRRTNSGGRIPMLFGYGMACLVIVGLRYHLRRMWRAGREDRFLTALGATPARLSRDGLVPVILRWALHVRRDGVDLDERR